MPGRAGGKTKKGPGLPLQKNKRRAGGGGSMKGTPQHSASITKNKDGTLNYGVAHSLRPVAA